MPGRQADRPVHRVALDSNQLWMLQGHCRASRGSKHCYGQHLQRLQARLHGQPHIQALACNHVTVVNGLYSASYLLLLTCPDEAQACRACNELVKGHLS